MPTPKFWVAESRAALEKLREQLLFPLIVKPRLSHVFEGRTGKKLLTVNDYDGVAAAVDEIAAAGTSSVLMEKVPGGDDRLCSYFTYLDQDSRPMFHFTKRIIRRYPVLSGTACYHVTDHIPEAIELANKLFRHVGLRGLANVEFKRDERDGKLKLIECNARFTASDCLVARSGIDLAAFVYCRITGRRLPPMGEYRTGMRLWDPIRDFQAYLELRRSGQLTFPRWLASVCHRQTFGYFRWTDPLPALARLTLPGAVKSIVLTIPVEAMKSEKNGLDKNMYKALKAAENPNIVFRLASPAIASGAENTAFHVAGELELAGKSQPIEVDVRASETPEGIVLEGSKALLMSDFGIKPPTMFLGTLKTADRVVVEWRLVLINDGF